MSGREAVLMVSTRPAVLEQYIGAAIRFTPTPADGDAARPIRVASTLLTCDAAAAILNDMCVREDSAAVYQYVNIHNPRCPLIFDRNKGRWSARVGFESHPMHGVNWAGAKLMCAHLGGRLPLAREWECFASNNDATRTYPWGDAKPTHLLANFGEHFGGATRVGSFPPSELGLYDLAGNVGEWCLDAYVGHGNETGVAQASVERVVKGGAWSKDAEHLEIANTRGKWERLGTTTIGFRTVWDER